MFEDRSNQAKASAWWSNLISLTLHCITLTLTLALTQIRTLTPTLSPYPYPDTGQGGAGEHQCGRLQLPRPLLHAVARADHGPTHGDPNPRAQPKARLRRRDRHGELKNAVRFKVCEGLKHECLRQPKPFAATVT